MNPPQTAAERRRALLDWIAERAEHDGMTASQIVDVCPGLYEGHGRYDRCFDDLKWLQREGHVTRFGRPAVWSLEVWEVAS